VNSVLDASALVVPNFETLERWAREKGLATGSREDLVRKPEVVEHYRRLIEALTPDLAQFEKIKRIALLPRELSQASGELTPSLKVKRRVVEERYEAQIDGMYGDAVTAPSADEGAARERARG